MSYFKPTNSSLFVVLLTLSMSVYSLEEGFYGGGTIYMSVLKNNNYVKAHFIDVKEKYWETFSGYENADGSVDIISYNTDNNARWTISNTEYGIKAIRGICLGECDGGNTELELDLIYPDTGGISGIYQSLGFETYIVHQVGNKAIGIELRKDPYNNEFDFALNRWDVINETTFEKVKTIYSTLGDLPFEATVRSILLGNDNHKTEVILEDCIITDTKWDLTCDDFEMILSSNKIF